MLNRHSQLNCAGSVHFVTTVTLSRGLWFVDESVCRAILESFEFARAQRNIACYGYVLMPDHIHALLFQPEEDFCVARMMESFKKFTSRKLRPPSYNGETLWREHYNDMAVPGRDALLVKLRYIHENPLRRGLVGDAAEYRWSSAGFYAGRGDGIVRITMP
ncbi:MAG: transposase [bacterium]|nr:transposase [bacterium]